MANEPADVFLYVAMASDDECWPWLGTWGGRKRDPRPYFMANGRRMISYRFVYELVHGCTLTPDQRMLHSCDRGGYPIGCCNPAHLRIGSAQDNMNDMMARERHGFPKTVVRAIRTLLAEGKTHQEIANTYGVARETITAIALQLTHKSVD